MNGKISWYLCFRSPYYTTHFFSTEVRLCSENLLQVNVYIDESEAGCCVHVNVGLIGVMFLFVRCVI